MSTEEKLLDAAAAIIERREYVVPSVAEIAREAGVTRPTFYAYFSTNLEVFEAVAARLRDRVLDIQSRADLGHATETFRFTLVAKLELYVENCGLLAVLAEQARLNERMRPLWNEIHSRPIRRHARFVDQLAAQGRARPAASGQIIAEAIDGVTARFAYIVAETPSRREEMADELINFHHRLVGLAEDGTQPDDRQSLRSPPHGTQADG